MLIVVLDLTHSLSLPTRSGRLRWHRRQAEKPKVNKRTRGVHVFTQSYQFLEPLTRGNGVHIFNWLIQEKTRHSEKHTRKATAWAVGTLSLLHKSESVYYFSALIKMPQVHRANAEQILITLKSMVCRWDLNCQKCSSNRNELMWSSQVPKWDMWEKQLRTTWTPNHSYWISYWIIMKMTPQTSITCHLKIKVIIQFYYLIYI